MILGMNDGNELLAFGELRITISSPKRIVRITTSLTKSRGTVEIWSY